MQTRQRGNQLMEQPLAQYTKHLHTTRHQTEQIRIDSLLAIIQIVFNFPRHQLTMIRYQPQLSKSKTNFD